MKETFWKTLVIGSVAMLITIYLILWQSKAIVQIFVSDVDTAEISEVFLKISSFALLAQGVVTTCSSMFQALGNTIPALIGSCVRLIAFVIISIWLSGQSTFRVEQVWSLAVVTLIMQGLVSLWLLRLEFKKRLLIFGDPTNSYEGARPPEWHE